MVTVLGWLLVIGLGVAAPVGPAKYGYLSYSEIVARMHQLAASHPDVMNLSTAQRDFHLEPVGQCGAEPCQVWIMRLGAADAPRVFISGALHGNERVGAIAALETAQWLLQAEQDPWATRMLATRSIVVIPMPNAIGFFSDKREELRRDPNRDFPFDQSPTECMTTLTARAINEVFIERPSQPILIAVTFHGGDNMIGWPWGDTAHGKRSKSPDQTAMELIGSRMRDWAGGAGGDGNYRVGTMTDTIYAVRGGMEDWAYGASWERKSFSAPCQPKGVAYSPSRTTYTRDALRCMVFLVETAHSKHPAEGTFGGSSELLFPGRAADGHVPRNIRLALQAIDVVRPYLELDVIPSTPSVVAGSTIQLSWRVGGALEVGKTQIEQRRGTAGEWEKVGKPLDGGRATPTLTCGSALAAECHKWAGQTYSASVVAEAAGASLWCLRAVAWDVDSSWSSGESHVGRQRRAVSSWHSEDHCVQVSDQPVSKSASSSPLVDSVWIEPAARASVQVNGTSMEALATQGSDGIGLGLGGEDIETSHLAGQTAHAVPPPIADMRRPEFHQAVPLTERRAPGAAGRAGVTMLQYGELVLVIVGIAGFVTMVQRVKLRNSKVNL